MFVNTTCLIAAVGHSVQSYCKLYPVRRCRAAGQITGDHSSLSSSCQLSVPKVRSVLSAIACREDFSQCMHCLAYEYVCVCHMQLHRRSQEVQWVHVHPQGGEKNLSQIYRGKL